MGKNQGNVATKFKFTDRELDKLKPPTGTQKQIYYRDTEVRGLVVSVGKGGKKSFHLYRRIDGPPKRIFLGDYPDMRIAEARAKAADLNSQLVQGINPFDERKRAREELTLARAFDNYADTHLTKKSAKSQREERRRFNQQVPEWLKNTQLSKITPTDAHDLHKAVRDGVRSNTPKDKLDQLSEAEQEYRGNYSANRLLQLLRAVMFYASKKKLFVGDNPFAHISLYPEAPRERFLEDHEVARLLTALEESNDPDLADFVRLSLYMGNRKMELLSLQWDWIDLDAGRITIPETKTKTKKKIHALLGKEELEILKTRRRFVFGDYVFPGTGKTKHRMDFKRSWGTLLKNAGLKNVHIHDLRRSLGSAIAVSGASPKIVSGVLNHKDIQTTLKHYLHVTRKQELEARKEVRKRWRDEQKKNAKKVTPIKKTQTEF